jgi:glycerophosphoryl diester phosphodiesterase
MERRGSFEIPEWHNGIFHVFEVDHAAVEFWMFNPFDQTMFAVGSSPQPWDTVDIKVPVFERKLKYKTRRIGYLRIHPAMFSDMTSSEKVCTQGFSCNRQITFRIILIEDDRRFRNAIPHHIPNMSVIGHRCSGANLMSYNFLENSIDGCKAALSNGASGVEIDVRLSKDDVVVLSHDEEVQDCVDPGQNHWIGEITAEEFKMSGKCTYWGVERASLKDFYDNVKGFGFLDFDFKFWFNIFDDKERFRFASKILNDIEDFGAGQPAFFCTFNVVIAAILGLIQKRYPVTVLVSMVENEEKKRFTDRIDALMKFANYIGLSGIVADSVQVLAFPGKFREVSQRLMLFSWGASNLDSDGIIRQLKLGVRGFVTDDVRFTKQLLENALMDKGH